MATHSPAKSGGTYTLTANTVDTVNLPTTGVGFLQVLNHDTTIWLYYTLDGSVPTVEGEGVLSLGPGAEAGWDALPGGVVKVIASTAVKYGVNF